MNKQHIEASQRLSECKGMEKSKDVLVKSEHLAEEIQPAERCETDTNIVAYISGDLLYKDDVQYYGSWICANDAFKFLQRCGYTIEQTNTGWGIRNRRDDNDWHRVAFFCDGDMHCPSDDIELAIIKAIIYIHDELPTAYNKGIEPLMGE